VLELPLPLAPVLGVVGVGVVGVGVLGEVVVLLLEPPAPEELLGVLPDAPLLVVPPALEPDLLKYASHSERDTWPSLFVSTAEKLGAEALLEVVPPEDMLPDAPLAELGVDMLPDELEPLADGVVVDGVVAEPDAPDDAPDDWLEPVAAGDEEEEDEDCATASVDSAKSTAAERVPTVFNIWTIPPEGIGKTASTCKQTQCLPSRQL
jgi:hypothetical protein